MHFKNIPLKCKMKDQSSLFPSQGRLLVVSVTNRDVGTRRRGPNLTGRIGAVLYRSGMAAPETQSQIAVKVEGGKKVLGLNHY